MRSRFLSAVPLVAASLVFLGSSSAHAQERFRGVFRLGVEHGGDEVLQFEYEDGSTPEVIAGGGMVLTAGGVLEAFRSGAHSVEAQGNLGLKYRTIPPATNQEAHWLRFPVEALVFYRSPVGVRVGGGAVVHLRNVLAASGDVADGRVEFRNSPGMLLQADYVRGSVAFDLRYTALKYELQGDGSGTVDASAIGVGISYFLGRSKRPAATPAPADGVPAPTQ